MYHISLLGCCLRYCKSTIFQANHNVIMKINWRLQVVCDTAKVRFFKQITTKGKIEEINVGLFAILQKYDFSSKSQQRPVMLEEFAGCLRYCKSTIFQANHNRCLYLLPFQLLFAILQKYDFSSKSQRTRRHREVAERCLRYCKSTIFQANHNHVRLICVSQKVVCDTAKVRFFKQITTATSTIWSQLGLFAILQKYDFSSKSQRDFNDKLTNGGCLRYCKSTIFQANHNA